MSGSISRLRKFTVKSEGKSHCDAHLGKLGNDDTDVLPTVARPTIALEGIVDIVVVFLL